MPASHRNGAEAERRKCLVGGNGWVPGGDENPTISTPSSFKEENLGPWEEDQAVVSQLVSYD